MDSYQRSRVADFFSHSPQTSQEDCHQFIVRTSNSVRVTPSLYQGSFSYTCIADPHHPLYSGKRTVVQFRREKLDLWGNTQAHQHYGQMAPSVRFRGEYRGFYVYTAPLAPGIPYIALLTASEESLSFIHRLRTVGDLAKVLSDHAQAPPEHSSVTTSLDSIQLTIDRFDFQNKPLKCWITTCISKIRQQDAYLAKLSRVLTHMDMTPFNYLVDATSGHLTAILDWEGAEYLPIGHNFHFVKNLFGYMTRDGWEDIEGCEVLESYFLESIRQNLISQGFVDGDLKAMEHEKILGILAYYVPKLFKWKEGLAERCLQNYLC